MERGASWGGRASFVVERRFSQQEIQERVAFSDWLAV